METFSASTEEKDLLKEVIAFVPLPTVPWGVLVGQAEKELFAPAHAYRRRMIPFALLMIAAILAVALLTTAAIVRPVQRLVAVSRRISSGDLATPVPVMERHELGALERAFEEMRLRLSARGEELDREVKAKTRDLEVSHRFLEIANSQTDLEPLLEGFIGEVSNFTGCTAVGIRLLDEAGNIPYQGYKGFSRGFYEKESPLSIHSDRCMCIDVIKGAADPSLPYHTAGGSFYINATSRFLQTLSEQERRKTRNECNRAGYESVALIPIRVGGSILGLIHVADPREDMAPLEKVLILESAAMEMGQGIQRIQGEVEGRRHAHHISVLYAVAQATAGALELEEKLTLAVEAVRKALQIGEAYKRAGVQSWAALPLKAGERLIGAIRLLSQRYDAFSDEELRALGSLAELVAVAVENARLYTEAQRRLARLATLREIDRAISAHLKLEDVIGVILKQVPPHLMEVEAVGLSLFDWKKREILMSITHLPGDVYVQDEAFLLSGNLLDDLALRRVPVVIYDLLADPRVQNHKNIIRQHGLKSYMGVPLVVQDRVIGILHVLTTKPRVFRDEEVDFFTTMAGQAAISLQNARLYEDVQASEQKYRSLFENSKDAVLISSRDRYFADVNPAAQAMFGYTRDELRSMKMRDLCTDPSEEAVLCSQIENSGFIKDLPFDLKRKDGSTISTLVSAEARTDAEGLLTGYQGIIRDITERKRAEKELAGLEEQFRQAQKMEAIGRLAGGIAHDFNNLLTVIKGYSEFLSAKLKKDKPAVTIVKQIDRAADRAAALTHQLLAFSRRQVMEPKVLDLNGLVRNAEKILRRIIEENIELVTVLDEGLGKVRVDPGQMEQVLMNLSVNAKDAMPTGGKLTIETANIYLDQAYAQRHIMVKPGDYVMLSVSDTGMGMSPEVKERLFEPFFTTKERGKGTGLSLSTVYGIVKQSGGNIWVYSEPGKGATFKIYLPRVDEPVEASEEKKTVQDLRGSEAILVVEDEEQVRELTCLMLQNLGYRVLEASTAEEALSICRELDEPIQLILTDVVLPAASGRQLVEQLEQLRHDFKVLYMSGYTDNAIAHHGILERGMHFISKPFSGESLAMKIREVLSTPPGGLA